MNFVEAYECMTQEDYMHTAFPVRRVGWAPRLNLCVEYEVFLDHTIDSERPHISRLRNRDVLILSLDPPNEKEEYCKTICRPWQPSHDDLIATDWEVYL